MGRIAHEKSDIVFVTSDNPRTENPDVVIDDIVSGFSADRFQRSKKSAEEPRDQIRHKEPLLQ